MLFDLSKRFFDAPNGQSFESVDEDDDPVAVAWQLDGRTVKYEDFRRYSDDSFNPRLPLELLYVSPRGTSQLRAVLADTKGELPSNR